MKVTIPGISTKYLQSFKLTKKIDNNFKVDSLDGEVIYDGPDHAYLVRAAATALDEEQGTVSKMCGEDEFSRDVFLKHTDGNFDLQTCQTKKRLHIKNSLDCVSDTEINIFDFTASDTKTLQGELIRRSTHFNEVQVVRDELEAGPRMTLNEVLSAVGSVPDRAFLGYFLEHAIIQMIVVTETQTDPTYGQYEQYLYHRITMHATYININSATQITPEWKPTLGGGYHYVLQQNLNGWGAEQIGDYPVTDFLGTTITYQNSSWQTGRYNQYVDRTISNTYFLNEILEEIFSCTGKTLISNFFGINSDGNYPLNKYYEWALLNTQDVKICQSFDIIRESALEDSFGISGKIKVKDLIGDICFIFNQMISETETNILLEHKSYFTGKGIDITAKDYELEPLEMNRENIDAERFTYAENFDNNSHYQAVLNYRTPNIYAQKNEQSKNTEKIVTDVFSAINNEKYNEGTYENLFFLLLTDGDKIIGLNSGLAMPAVIKTLHDMDRPLKVTTFEGETTKYYFENYSIGFSTSLRFQSNVLMWQLLEPNMSIITKEGTFLIEELTIDDNDTMEATLKK